MNEWLGRSYRFDYRVSIGKVTGLVALGSWLIKMAPSSVLESSNKEWCTINNRRLSDDSTLEMEGLKT